MGKITNTALFSVQLACFTFCRMTLTYPKYRLTPEYFTLKKLPTYLQINLTV